MDTFKTFPATKPMSDLCAKQRDRQLVERSATLSRYKMEEEDGEILMKFHREYTEKIRQDALAAGRTIGDPAFIGPRVLDSGSLTAPPQTTALLIPMALSFPSQNHTTEAVYQRDKDVADVQESLPWRIGTPIQMFGNSRVITKGPICFQSIRYTYEPVQDQIKEGTAERASR